MLRTLLDPVIHPALRLQICARLARTEAADFASVRAALDVSESVLSKQAKLLQDAGYLAVRKAVSGGRQRAWLSLTPTGLAAFAAHSAALRSLLG